MARTSFHQAEARRGCRRTGRDPTGSTELRYYLPVTSRSRTRFPGLIGQKVDAPYGHKAARECCAPAQGGTFDETLHHAG